MNKQHADKINVEIRKYTNEIEQMLKQQENYNVELKLLDESLKKLDEIKTELSSITTEKTKVQTE